MSAEGVTVKRIVTERHDQHLGNVLLIPNESPQEVYHEFVTAWSLAHCDRVTVAFLSVREVHSPETINT